MHRNRIIIKFLKVREIMAPPDKRTECYEKELIRKIERPHEK
jgi:hypothetical protein